MTATFLLGTHQPNWLTEIPLSLFVSDTRLRKLKKLPRAAAPWALDSGGFTELKKHGAWTVGPADYAARVRRYRDQIGQLRWAAPQDWMCEPIIINGGQIGSNKYVGTHLSVDEHQWRTVANLVHLRSIAPDLPWIPVLQGYTLAEYLRCIDRYGLAGIDLTREPLVGLGSVCRRQASSEIHQIVTAVRERGITRLHGFGVKTLGLERYGHLLTSADSMAWSQVARRERLRLPGCTAHKNCANCPKWALRWRTKVISQLDTAGEA